MSREQEYVERKKRENMIKKKGGIGRKQERKGKKRQERKK